MADETENNPAAAAGDDDSGEISWDDVAEDMEKQKQLLHEEAAAGLETKQADAVDAPANTADGDVTNKAGIDFVLDIPLTVTVELGRSKMLINDLLQLGQGSVIELSKLVGEPLEVRVNNKLVARGEVVVVNEKFGIRLTDIVSAMERIERLGE